MKLSAPIEPIDYLVIGHITQDLTPAGPILGGTVAYAALTAQALGVRVGIVTACNADLSIAELNGIPVVIKPSVNTSTFENIQTPEGRIQYLHHRADDIDLDCVPHVWRQTPIVHLGPLTNEVDRSMVAAFPNSQVSMTPQGWMRKWDDKKRISFQPWPDDEAMQYLPKAAAAVMSVEDVEGNEKRIEEIASNIRILAVTEGAAGARLYWNGDMRRFRPPKMVEVDPLGAGDIFAAAFQYRLHGTQNPWEAARFATQLASFSVTRRGLSGVPTPAEVDACHIEILSKN